MEAPKAYMGNARGLRRKPEESESKEEKETPVALRQDGMVKIDEETRRINRMLAGEESDPYETPDAEKIH